MATETHPEVTAIVPLPEAPRIEPITWKPQLVVRDTYIRPSLETVVTSPVLAENVTELTNHGQQLIGEMTAYLAAREAAIAKGKPLDNNIINTTGYSQDRLENATQAIFRIKPTTDETTVGRINARRKQRAERLMIEQTAATIASGTFDGDIADGIAADRLGALLGVPFEEAIVMVASVRNKNNVTTLESPDTAARMEKRNKRRARRQNLLEMFIKDDNAADALYASRELLRNNVPAAAELINSGADTVFRLPDFGIEVLSPIEEQQPETHRLTVVETEQPNVIRNIAAFAAVLLLSAACTTGPDAQNAATNTPNSSPTPSGTPTITLTPTETVTSTLTPTVTNTPTFTPSPTLTASPTLTPSPTLTATNTPDFAATIAAETQTALIATATRTAELTCVRQLQGIIDVNTTGRLGTDRNLNGTPVFTEGISDRQTGWMLPPIPALEALNDPNIYNTLLGAFAEIQRFMATGSGDSLNPANSGRMLNLLCGDGVTAADFIQPTAAAVINDRRGYTDGTTGEVDILERYYGLSQPQFNARMNISSGLITRALTNGVTPPDAAAPVIALADILPAGTDIAAFRSDLGITTINISLVPNGQINQETRGIGPADTTGEFQMLTAVINADNTVTLSVHHLPSQIFTNPNFVNYPDSGPFQMFTLRDNGSVNGLQVNPSDQTFIFNGTPVPANDFSSFASSGPAIRMGFGNGSNRITSEFIFDIVTGLPVVKVMGVTTTTGNGPVGTIVTTPGTNFATSTPGFGGPTSTPGGGVTEQPPTPVIVSTPTPADFLSPTPVDNTLPTPVDVGPPTPADTDNDGGDDNDDDNDSGGNTGNQPPQEADIQPPEAVDTENQGG